MKLKELINKEVELTIVVGSLFNKSDIENFGEDYEVSEEQITDRLNSMIINHKIEVSDYETYKLRD